MDRHSTYYKKCAINMSYNGNDVLMLDFRPRRLELVKRDLVEIGIESKQMTAEVLLSYLNFYLDIPQPLLGRRQVSCLLCRN